MLEGPSIKPDDAFWDCFEEERKPEFDAQFDADGIPHSFLELAGLPRLHAADGCHELQVDRITFASKQCATQMKRVQQRQIETMQAMARHAIDKGKSANDATAAATHERAAAANVVWNSQLKALQNLRRLLAVRMVNHRYASSCLIP